MSPAVPIPLPDLPLRPPFVLRARLLTPLDRGGTRYESDGVLVVDAAGRIAEVGPWPADSGRGWPVFDLRPLVLLPGMVDLHVHLPQVPAAGVGAGLDLLTWLERHIFSLERAFRAPVAEALVPPHLPRHGGVRHDHHPGLRRHLGRQPRRGVPGGGDARHPGDAGRRDDGPAELRRGDPAGERLERSLRDSASLCERWDGAADGRLGYAFTPRFAVSCSCRAAAGVGARLPTRHGAIWQTHVSEDAREIADGPGAVPRCPDYLDVYDRAGGLGPRSVFAHAIHLSERELARLVASGSRIAHCPVSNLFISSGVMPLARYLEAGATVGLGSDVAGLAGAVHPDPDAHRLLRPERAPGRDRRSATDRRSRWDCSAWARSRAPARSGSIAVTGSLEVGKEADLIAIDPRMTLPPGGEDSDDPDAIMSLLIFRERPGMVRGAWVRGRSLPM